MTQSYSFNLLDEAWLPCLRPNGRMELLSLRQVLLGAHELQELGGDSPLERMSLHRLLLAVLHRVFGPADYDAWEDLWTAGYFPAAPLEEYCAHWHHRFDLFDSRRPFYQAADDRVRTKSVISLVHDLASGNNPTLFDHHTEEKGISLTPGRAARVLITAHVFGLSGTCHPGHGLYFTDGPCARGVLFLIAGDNLFQTLMLNMIQYPADEPVACTELDRPAWEMEDPYTPEREMPLGYLDYLTWQSRRILLEADSSASGTVVRSTTVSPGLAASPEIRDPMMHYRVEDKQKQYKIFRFHEGRALWRDSAALFALHGSEENLAPLTFRWLHELVYEGILDRRRVYRNLALGMSSRPGQQVIYSYREESLPFPLSYLDSPELVQDLRSASDAADQAASKFRRAGRELAKYLLAPLADTKQARTPADGDLGDLIDHWGSERQFWTALDRPFQSLVVDLSQEGDAALERWHETLWRAAWDALEHAIRQAGDDVRALKAAVQARRQLGAGLRKIPVLQNENAKEKSI